MNIPECIVPAIIDALKDQIEDYEAIAEWGEETPQTKEKLRAYKAAAEKLKQLEIPF